MITERGDNLGIRSKTISKTRDSYTALVVGGVLSLVWLAGLVISTPASSSQLDSQWYDAGRAVTFMSPGIYMALLADMLLTGGHGSGNPWLLGLIAESINFPVFSGLTYLALRGFARVAGKSAKARSGL